MMSLKTEGGEGGGEGGGLATSKFKNDALKKMSILFYF